MRRGLLHVFRSIFCPTAPPTNLWWGAVNNLHFFLMQTQQQRIEMRLTPGIHGNTALGVRHTALPKVFLGGGTGDGSLGSGFSAKCFRFFGFFCGPNRNGLVLAERSPPGWISKPSSSCLAPQANPQKGLWMMDFLSLKCALATPTVSRVGHFVVDCASTEWRKRLTSLNPKHCISLFFVFAAKISCHFFRLVSPPDRQRVQGRIPAHGDGAGLLHPNL